MTLETKRVLVISIDGLDARYLEKRDEYGLRVPTLRRLMAEGLTSLQVVPVYPSVTYPVHTTIVTGALPARHGIVGNELFLPLGAPDCGEWHWFARDIKAETLWDAAACAGLSSGIVSWPVAGGSGDYNVPEIKKQDAPPVESLALMKAYQRPRGIIEEVEARYPDLYRNANMDEHDDMRTRFAEYIIKEKRPHLMLVHLFDLDHFQHDFGPFTPRAFEMLEKIDGYAARIMEAARGAGTLSETAIFIVSDHGFQPISKLIHPGVLLARAGLLKVCRQEEEETARGRERLTVKEWSALPHLTGGSCAIILREQSDTRTLERARQAFACLAGLGGEEVASGTAQPALKIIEASEVRALGANPRAALMLEAADGYAFGQNYEGEAVTPSVQAGQHGYLPSRYMTTFIAAGCGVSRRGGQLGEVNITDVGPTIAHALGLTLRDADGHPFKLS